MGKSEMGIENVTVDSKVDSNDMEILLEMGIKNLIQVCKGIENLPQYSNELENGFQENNDKKLDVYFVVSETVRRTSPTRKIKTKEIKRAEEEIKNFPAEE